MRRKWIATIVIVIAAAGAAAYQIGKHWKRYDYVGTRLMVDLSRPDAVIRTTSLSKLPRDLLKVPIARDVLTEDLAFYYEQHEDRLGLNGAIKRIAYEHNVEWTDRIFASIFNEPAEVAFWRDGKGALRHYAVVIRRNTFAKIIEQAANVAMKDSQLKLAGEISTANGTAKVMALELNPRRTLLLIAQGDQIVALSDPGLLLNDSNSMVSESKAAIVDWFNHPGSLSQQFALDSIQADSKPNPNEARHTLAIGAPTMAIGYGAFMPGFKGMRFDFGGTWSTSIWLDQKTLPSSHLLSPALWSAAPANPSACVTLPIDWTSVIKVVNEADTKPNLPEKAALSALSSPAIACWYNESKLYSPVFITQLASGTPNRKETLDALAKWAIGAEELENVTGKAKKNKQEIQRWRNAQTQATLASSGDFVVFSPDADLVQKVTDTIARNHPSVADQTANTVSMLGLITPRSLSQMAQREIDAALSGSEDENFLNAVHTHLPARLKALSSYAPIRLELSQLRATPQAWQKVEWVEKNK